MSSDTTSVREVALHFQNNSFLTLPVSGGDTRAILTLGYGDTHNACACSLSRAHSESSMCRLSGTLCAYRWPPRAQSARLIRGLPLMSTGFLAVSDTSRCAVQTPLRIEKGVLYSPPRVSFMTP